MKWRRSSVFQFFLLVARQFLRDPAALFWSFGFPVLVVALIAPAFSGGGRERYVVATVGVENEWRGRLVASPALAVKSVDSFFEGHPDWRESLERARAFDQLPLPVRRVFGEVGADFLVSPYGIFSSRAENGVGLVTEFVNRARTASAEPLPFRALSIPGTRFVDWFIPGALALSLLSFGLLFVVQRIVGDRERGMFRRLRLGPFRPEAYLAGFIAAYLAIACALIVTLQSLFSIAYGFRILGSPWAYGLLALLGAATIGALGLAIAARVKSVQVAGGFANGIYFPLMFASGIYFKVEAFPETLHPLLAWLPLSPVTSGLRAIALRGATLSDVGPQLGVLTAWLVGAIALAWFRFDWGGAEGDRGFRERWGGILRVVRPGNSRQALWCLSFSCTLAALVASSALWPRGILPFSALMALHFIYIIWAVSDLRSQFFCRALVAQPARRDAMALTFDDGPDPRVTPEVLDILARHGHKATFFVVARNAEANPELLRRMVREGHSVGCHDLSHGLDSNLRSLSRMQSEIRRSVDIIETILGRKPTLYRPPFGLANPRLGFVLEVLGLTCVGWTQRARDAGNRRKNLDRTLPRLAKGGAVVLLHDALPRPENKGEFLVGLENLCVRMEEQGLRGVTVEELFGRSSSHWDRFFAQSSGEPTYDGWLEPWLPSLPRALPVLDLGCGQGADTMRLVESGFRVVACDLSEEALRSLALRCPAAELRNVDHSKPLPFVDQRFGAVVADLTLHYFDERTTDGILAEIRRVLCPGGLLLVRVNATEESRADLDGKKGRLVEPSYFDIEGHFKRYFDEASIGRFFGGWQRVHVRRGTTRKFGEQKFLWEIVLRNEGA